METNTLVAGMTAALFCGANACAAGQQTGQILDLRVSSPTLINPTHILIGGNYQNRPSCATLPFWQIDSDTVSGKNILATIMLAGALGKQIAITGSGACAPRADMESIVQIQILWQP